jgi:regulatory protein
MAKITAIVPQNRNPNRVKIHLNGEDSFGVSARLAVHLQVGQDLSGEQIAALQGEDAREGAYERALEFLSYRARSEAEIRRHLKKHEVPEDLIEHTLGRLRQNQLADDSGFARAWVENRGSFRPRGRHALAWELRQKGLSIDDMQAALVGLDEPALAYQAGLKQARRLSALDWNEFRSKLSGFLGRRGFPYPVVVSVVSRIWTETHPAQNFSDDKEIT